MPATTAITSRMAARPQLMGSSSLLPGDASPVTPQTLSGGRGGLHGISRRCNDCWALTRRPTDRRWRRVPVGMAAQRRSTSPALNRACAEASDLSARRRVPPPFHDLQRGLEPASAPASSPMTGLQRAETGCRFCALGLGFRDRPLVAMNTGNDTDTPRDHL